MKPAAVTACTWGAGRDGPPSGVEELLTLGRRVSTSLGTDLSWLALGPMRGNTMEVATRYGVAAIDRVDDAKMGRFQPDSYVEALAQYCAERLPTALLFSQTYDVRLVAPRLAGRLGSDVVINAVDLEVGRDGWPRVTVSAYGGDTRAVYELTGAGTHIVSLMPNTIPPEPLESAASSPTVQDIPVDLSGVEERIRVVEHAHAEGPRLEDAEIIVAGGRGLGSPENYRLVEELAEALGGMTGACRPIVDDGWVDPSRQVGLTGAIAQPALYIAAGISGASQHMAGCSAAKTIVAINRDPDAAIFRYARYGIVGDCLEVLPKLTQAVKGP